jgi:transposase
MNAMTGFKTTYCAACDVHAQKTTVHVIDREGNKLVHRSVDSKPQAFLELVSPFAKDLTVCAESTFNWYWLNDICVQNGISFDLGHALYIKRTKQGKHKTDDIDAEHMAQLMSDNHFPLAYSYPADMRPTRDLLRRRMHFVNRRAGAFAHIKILFYQQGIMDETIADLLEKKLLRRSVIQKMCDKTIRQSIEANFAFIDSLDSITKTLEKQALETAIAFDKKSYSVLQSMPGLGTILSLTILYEIYTIDRFESVQAFSSYCRTVKAQCNSAGKTV